MSLYDFYMYLKHMEYSEEKLEFYIWYVVRPCPRWSSLKLKKRNYDAGSDEDIAPPCTSESTSSDVKLKEEASSLTTADSEGGKTWSSASLHLV